MTTSGTRTAEGSSSGWVPAWIVRTACNSSICFHERVICRQVAPPVSDPAASAAQVAGLVSARADTGAARALSSTYDRGGIPVREKQDSKGSSGFKSHLRSVHPDARDLRPKCCDWILGSLSSKRTEPRCDSGSACNLPAANHSMPTPQQRHGGLSGPSSPSLPEATLR